MASNMVSLGTSSTAIFPLASQAEIIGAFPSNMIVAQMTVQSLRIGKGLCAIDP